MVSEVVYPETYKMTLTAVINNVENAYGALVADKLSNRIDGVVKKIVKNPNLYQAIPIDPKGCHFPPIFISL